MGNQIKQLQVLQEKCLDFAKVVQTNALSRYDSTIFFFHIYIPSVTYPLQSTFFTKKELDLIQSVANRSLTQSCGYNGRTPFIILYGPSEIWRSGFHQSLRCSRPFANSDVHQTLANPSDISTLLRICLHWWQFVAGISTPILEANQIKLPHLDEESKLISSMRHYLGSINAQIEVDDPGVPPPQRENNVPFMEAILNDPNFSTMDKKYTNHIRMFHNVFWVSDIAKADSLDINTSMRAGPPSLMSSSHNRKICHQECPTPPAAWAAFRKACNVHTTSQWPSQAIFRQMVAPSSQAQMKMAFLL